MLSCVINADSLSDLKLYEVDHPVPSLLITFLLSSVDLDKFIKPVLCELYVSLRLNQIYIIYKDPFIL